MYRRTLFAALVALPALAAAQQAKPGQWEIVRTIKSAELPGASAAQIAKMKGNSSVSSRCLTAANAAKRPDELIPSNKQCKVPRYSRQNGKLDSQMVCSDKGATMTVTTTGNYTPTSFSNTSTMVRSGTPKMAMTTVTVAKWVGPCKK